MIKLVLKCMLLGSVFSQHSFATDLGGSSRDEVVNPLGSGKIDFFINPSDIQQSIASALSSARRQIIICSPFLSNNSMKNSGFEKVLERKIREGVSVGVVTCASLTSTKQYEVKGIEVLQRIGARVVFLDNIHAKYVLVDDQTAYMGSFNPLSGSFNPSYQYYQLNVMVKFTQEHAKPIFDHALSIADATRPILEPTLLNGIQILSRPKDIRDLQMKMIRGAKKDLEICSPNISLNMIEVGGFLDALDIKVNRDGVRTTVLTDSEMDGTKPEAMRGRYALVRKNVRLMLKKAIHLKYIIQDDDALYLGSDNLFGGTARDSGEGFWKELGVYIPHAKPFIDQIRHAIENQDTVLDGAFVSASDIKLDPEISAPRLRSESDAVEERAAMPLAAPKPEPVLEHVVDPSHVPLVPKVYALPLMAGPGAMAGGGSSAPPIQPLFPSLQVLGSGGGGSSSGAPHVGAGAGAGSGMIVLDEEAEKPAVTVLKEDALKKTSRSKKHKRYEESSSGSESDDESSSDSSSSESSSDDGKEFKAFKKWQKAQKHASHKKRDHGKKHRHSKKHHKGRK